MPTISALSIVVEIQKGVTDMESLTKSVLINAPVEKVFNHVADPTSHPKFWSAISDITNVQTLPNGGRSFNWKYKMGGMRFDGASEWKEYIPNQRIVSVSTKGIDSTIRWLFQPEAGGTRMTFEVEYRIPVPLIGKVAENMLIKQNEGVAKELLANLKAQMEA